MVVGISDGFCGRDHDQREPAKEALVKPGGSGNCDFDYADRKLRWRKLRLRRRRWRSGNTGGLLERYSDSFCDFRQRNPDAFRYFRTLRPIGNRRVMISGLELSPDCYCRPQWSAGRAMAEG